MQLSLFVAIISNLAVACSCGSTAGIGGDDASTRRDGSGADGAGVDGNRGDSNNGGDAGWQNQIAELWYSVEEQLVHIPIDTVNGKPLAFTSSEVKGLPLGQNAITMLPDGSILGARLSDDDALTYFYHISTPPRDGSQVVPTMLGIMPDKIRVEGLHTDCEGRVYVMDTGSDNTNADGNRLLLFTGDYLSGDFAFQIVSDLSTADVADIDDMGPGLDGNQVTDNPGLAIDTGHVHDFNYETGTGTEVGQGGTFGIHVLGGPLFDDDQSRLYVFDDDAKLYEMDPQTFDVSPSLGQGPQVNAGARGWSGLGGPLTDCVSGFVTVD